MKKKITKKRKMNEIRSLLLQLIDAEIQKNNHNSKNNILINSMTREEITKKYEAFNNYKIETDYDIYTNNENEYEYYCTSFNFDCTSRTLISPRKNKILRQDTYKTEKKNKSSTNCPEFFLLDETKEKLSPLKAVQKLEIGEKKLLKEKDDEKNIIKDNNLLKFTLNGPMIKKKDTIGTITAINNALLKVEIQYEFEEMKKKKKKEIEIKQKKAIRNLRHFCFTYLKLKNKNDNTITERKQSEGNIAKITKKNKNQSLKFSNVNKKNKKNSSKNQLTKNSINLNKAEQSSKTKSNYSAYLKNCLDDEENKNKKNLKKTKKIHDTANNSEILEKKKLKTEITQFDKSLIPKSKFYKNNKIKNNNNKNLCNTNRKSYQNNHINFTFALEKTQDENSENIKSKKTRVSSRHMTHKTGKNIFLKNIEKTADSKVSKELEKMRKTNRKKLTSVEKNDGLFNININLNSLRSNVNNENESFLNFYNSNNSKKKPVKIQDWTNKTEKNKKKTNIDNFNMLPPPLEFNDEDNTSVNSEKIQEKPQKKTTFQRSKKRKLTYDKRHINN